MHLQPWWQRPADLLCHALPPRRRVSCHLSSQGRQSLAAPLSRRNLLIKKIKGENFPAGMGLAFSWSTDGPTGRTVSPSGTVDNVRLGIRRICRRRRQPIRHGRTICMKNTGEAYEALPCTHTTEQCSPRLDDIRRCPRRCLPQHAVPGGVGPRHPPLPCPAPSRCQRGTSRSCWDMPQVPRTTCVSRSILALPGPFSVHRLPCSATMPYK